MMDLNHNLCNDFQIILTQALNRITDNTIGVIFDRNHTKLCLAAVNFTKDSFDRPNRQISTHSAKTALCCLMRKGRLRSQISNTLGKLQVSGNRKEFKKECIDGRVGQFPIILRFETIEDCLLSLRSIDWCACGILEFADTMDIFHALIQQLQQGIVDPIYTFSQFIKCHL